MDWFLMQYLNNKYAVTLHECVKKSGTQLLMAGGIPLSVLDCQSNCPSYDLFTYAPKMKLIRGVIVAHSLKKTLMF